MKFALLSALTLTITFVTIDAFANRSEVIRKFDCNDDGTQIWVYADYKADLTLTPYSTRMTVMVRGVQRGVLKLVALEKVGVNQSEYRIATSPNSIDQIGDAALRKVVPGQPLVFEMKLATRELECRELPPQTR